MNDNTPPPIILEVAAALLVPAASVGFIRVFDTSEAVTPLVGAALLSTTIAILLRRIRFPLLVTAPLSALFLVVLIVNRFGPGTARFGLVPTDATREQFRLLINELILNFQELKTPVPALDGFVAAGMIGAWVMAFLTDWGALRLRLAFEPVLPAALLFIFSSVLGAGTNQISTTLIFALAVAVWAVTQRSVNLAEANTWLANDRGRGARVVARTAAVVSAVALLGGSIIGPRLPGAAADAMISFRDNGDPTRLVISPYVSIESRLVNQTATQLFTVASEQPSYWRLAGLDTYEDNIWKVAGNFSPEDGRLPGMGNLQGQRDNVIQDFSIDALDAIWLPAAFAPAEIRDSTAKVTWNAESGSLTVANDIPTSDGVDYTVVSSVPRFTSEELRAAPATQPFEIAEQFLALPEVPAIVRDEAQRITSASSTRYDQMLALQSYFRQFSYSVNLGPPTGDPIEQFLNERVGFCQQFAGTFAVMARTLGVPARVAIGFTWGDPIDVDDQGRTIYRVTGRQTHAWPEVWFEGLGWVAFEPTPGRGAPSAVEYTQIAAAQDSLVQPDNPGGPITTTTIDAAAVNPAPNQPTVPEFDLEDQGPAPTPDDGGPSAGTVLRWLGAAGVVGAYAGGIPGWFWYRRQRRRQSVTTPADEVETAWAEVSESVELNYRMTRKPWETRREYAHRLAGDFRFPGEPMQALAEKVTVARYHPTGLGPHDAEEASELARQIEQTMHQRVSAFDRWKRMVDPRRLIRPSARLMVTDTLGPSSAGPAETNGHHPEPTRPLTPTG